jgi:tryptophan synthase alpha chain
MNRITSQFERLKNEGRRGFIPFVTAGDPDLDTTREIVSALASLGADVIELGVPFSDPMADGPTIQASSQRALTNRVTLGPMLELVADIRRSSKVPIVLFSYLNPLLRFGINELAGKAADAGVDGVLITDVVGREAQTIAEVFRQQNIDLISLIAPTTSDSRLREIAEKSGGFLYAVSRAGVTGAREQMSSDAEVLVRRAREVSDLPVAVGFGISTMEQIKDVWRYADAAVVGSAIVNQIADANEGNEAGAVERFVRSILPTFANTVTQT